MLYKLAIANHSTKFQIDKPIFDPRKPNFFLQQNAYDDVIK